MRGTTRPIHEVATRVKRQPPKVKTFLCVVAGMAALVFLGCIIDDDDNNLFVAAEAVHALGISVLIYKLTKERTCAGLSLKSQNLTALFLAARLYCSLVMEYNIHTVLDTALATTLWVIYMIRLRLKTSYMEDKDNFAISYVIVPCALLALAVHPSTSDNIFYRICVAFCVCLEAVSVLPQLRLMQNTKIAEPFTAHYVFALGIARFLNSAYWVLKVRRSVCPCSAKDDVSVGLIFTGRYIFNKVFDTCGRLLTALGYGLWPSMVFLAEIVQTSILAEFCFYYVKSLVGGNWC